MEKNEGDYDGLKEILLKHQADVQTTLAHVDALLNNYYDIMKYK